VKIDQKTVKHSPAQKLTDALVGMLAGCKAIYETNARVRPDVPLQQAFGRKRVAEQSTIQRTLDAFTQENVCELREAVEAIGGRYSGLPQHPYDQQMLVVEVDLTGLRASKRAELSTKGYFSGERNATGRQLVRASAPLYGEVIFSKLHAGNTTSCEVLKQTMNEVERLLKSFPNKRSRTLIRLDGGFGTDENVEWLCTSGYQFVVKGYGGGRAGKLVRSVAEDGWHEGPTAGQFLGVPTRGAPRYSRQTKTVVRRWSDAKGKLYTDHLLSTLTDLTADQIAKLYDGRGGMEVDIKGDKRGLGIENRRKKGFFAQEAVALLAQLSHNLLAYFKGWLLGGTDAAKLGVERLFREVLAIPAEARMGRRRGAKLLLKLPELHPWAEALARGTQARFPPSGWRTIWRKN
jgi:Transposase DDE domain group 1